MMDFLQNTHLVGLRVKFYVFYFERPLQSFETMKKRLLVLRNHVNRKILILHTFNTLD